MLKGSIAIGEYPGGGVEAYALTASRATEMLMAGIAELPQYE